MDHEILRGGRSSSIFAVMESLGRANSRRTAPTNLEALIRGAASRFLHALVLPPAGACSAGRELTTSSTPHPLDSSAVAKARASVVFPAAGGPKSSIIMRRNFRKNNARCGGSLGVGRGSRYELRRNHASTWRDRAAGNLRARRPWQDIDPHENRPTDAPGFLRAGGPVSWSCLLRRKAKILA